MLVGQRPIKSLSSVTTFSQDWISFFSDIVHDDSWPWYLATDEARFLKKNSGGPNLGQNRIQN